MAVDLSTDDDGNHVMTATSYIVCRAIVPPELTPLTTGHRAVVVKHVTEAVERAMVTALVEQNLTEEKSRRFAQHIIRSALDGQDSFIDRRNFDRFLDRGN